MTLSRSLPPKPPKEADIQRAIVKYLRSIGCVVYVLSQGYRKERGGTRQTPGLPDLYVFAPGPTRRAFWWETKRPGGWRTKPQLWFAEHCAAFDVDYGTGDMPALLRRLRLWGIITARPVSERNEP